MASRPNAELSVDSPGESSEEPGAAFASFVDEPKQMPSGAVGKNGFLNLGFVQRNRRTILGDLKSRIPYLAQRVLHCDENMPDLAWLFVITTTGCVLQGDRMTLKIDIGTGAKAHVTTQAATKVHAMDANYARQIQTITLDEGAYLEYLPEPLIPHRQARYANHTKITVAPTASLLYGEMFSRAASTIIPTSASAQRCSPS
jgi:urease accessory protein